MKTCCNSIIYSVFFLRLAMGVGGADRVCNWEEQIQNCTNDQVCHNIKTRAADVRKTNYLTSVNVCWEILSLANYSDATWLRRQTCWSSRPQRPAHIPWQQPLGRGLPLRRTHTHKSLTVTAWEHSALHCSFSYDLIRFPWSCCKKKKKRLKWLVETLGTVLLSLPVWVLLGDFKVSCS